MAKQQQSSKVKANKTSLSLVFIGVFVLFFCLAVVSFFLSNIRGDTAKSFLQGSTALQVLSQQIGKNASEAAQGNKTAFAELDSARNEFDSSWEILSKGNINSTLSLGKDFTKNATQEIQAVDKIWRRVDESSRTIIDNQKIILNLHETADLIKFKVPELSQSLESIVSTLVNNKASADIIRNVQEQIIFAGRYIQQINSVLEGGKIARLGAEEFSRDVQEFSKLMNRLKVIASSKNLDSSTINQIENDFQAIKNTTDTVSQSYEKFIAVREAQSNIFKNTSTLLAQTAEFSDKIDSQESSFLSSFPVGLTAALIAVLALFGVSIDSSRQARSRLNAEERVRREQEETNRRNQEAILRLLDELSALADGDLTIQTTVTGEFTGAICDSINFTIEQLRSLVSTINDTAVKVSGAAQETQSTAMQLAEASEHQAQEIAGASTAINEIAASIDQVSANAAESALVAERSVTIANKGSQVVQNTTKGMDTIREQIQETAKRIKRLGESSQEIGDIVSLITDIADQTNILALNAAIQASMAGDAGRGFAVVADEVQRLAERSSAATKQIEAIVRTIQTDTHEAVTSMEHTTAEVVQGTRLAQDAGIALEEIESVSRSLADLIQNISNAARQQAASAGHISNTMNVIQEITSQTSNGTIATAQSIGNLAGLAVEMRKTVAGFKLPEN